MPNLQGGISGAAGGAGVGSLFGPVGAGVGAGVGFLAGLFGSKSAEQESQERADQVRQYLARLRLENRQAKLKVLKEGTERLGKFGGTQIALARGSAAERSAALGRYGDAEPAVLAAEQQASTQANRLLGDFQATTEREFENRDLALSMQGLGIEQDFANRPMQPGVGDYLLGIGKEAFTFSQNQEMMKTQRETAPTSSTAVIKPATASFSVNGGPSMSAPIQSGQTSVTPLSRPFDPGAMENKAFYSGFAQPARPGQVGRMANRSGFGGVRVPSFAN